MMREQPRQLHSQDLDKQSDILGKRIQSTLAQVASYAHEHPELAQPAQDEKQRLLATFGDKLGVSALEALLLAPQPEDWRSSTTGAIRLMGACLALEERYQERDRLQSGRD